MKAKLRERRSSLAMTSFALCFLQAASAFSNSGLSFRFPLSISVNSAADPEICDEFPVMCRHALPKCAHVSDEGPPPPVQIVQDRFPLCFEAKPRFALPIRGKLLRLDPWGRK
jgi:hypothetical protein